MASISKKANRGAAKESGHQAGARHGEQRSSGARPSGTNLDRGGGSAARNQRTSGSGARRKGPRST